MSEFEFVENLPESRVNTNRSSRQLVARFADALRQRPGEWAKYPVPTRSAGNTYAYASRIRKASDVAPKPFKDGGFEAHVATTEDGEKVLYVRYVGAKS